MKERRKRKAAECTCRESSERLKEYKEWDTVKEREEGAIQWGTEMYWINTSRKSVNKRKTETNQLFDGVKYYIGIKYNDGVLSMFTFIWFKNPNDIFCWNTINPIYA